MLMGLITALAMLRARRFLIRVAHETAKLANFARFLPAELAPLVGEDDVETWRQGRRQQGTILFVDTWRPTSSSCPFTLSPAGSSTRTKWSKSWPLSFPTLTGRKRTESSSPNGVPMVEATFDAASAGKNPGFRSSRHWFSPRNRSSLPRRPHGVPHPRPCGHRQPRLGRHGTVHRSSGPRRSQGGRHDERCPTRTCKVVDRPASSKHRPHRGRKGHDKLSGPSGRSRGP